MELHCKGDINLIIKYCPSCLNELTFKENIFID